MPAHAPSLPRLVLACVVAFGAMAAFDASAQTAEKPAAKKKADDKKTSAQPGATAVATYGDWTVFTAQSGRSKICFAQSEPKARTPSSIKDTKGYLFVSVRPADNVRNELAAVLNFETKDGGPATLAVGQTTYDLVTKGKNAWVKNPSDEAAAVSTMAKGSSMTVQATSSKGNKTSDRYSLTGFGQALERARKDCP